MKYMQLAKLEWIAAGHENPSSPGVIKKVLLNRFDELNGKLMMLNYAMIKPGESFNEHYHNGMDEVFVIVCGNAIMRIESEVVKMSKGDMMLVHAGETHKMYNMGHVDLEYIVFGVAGNRDVETVVLDSETNT